MAHFSKHERHRPLNREQAIILGCIIHFARRAESKNKKDKEGYCFISHAEVARRTGIQIRLVNASIRSLWVRGILEIKMIGTSYKRYYKIRLDELKARCPPYRRARLQ